MPQFSLQNDWCRLPKRNQIIPMKWNLGLTVLGGSMSRWSELGRTFKIHDITFTGCLNHCSTWLLEHHRMWAFVHEHLRLRVFLGKNSPPKFPSQNFIQRQLIWLARTLFLLFLIVFELQIWKVNPNSPPFTEPYS